MLWWGWSASAESLRCQSVNGNLNCAGSGGVSCQTVNGRKVCISGHGDVIQSFGGDQSAGDRSMDMPDDEGLDDLPGVRQRPRRQAANPRPYPDWKLIDRE